MSYYSFNYTLYRVRKDCEQYAESHPEESRDDWPEYVYREIIQKRLPDNSDENTWAYLIYTEPGILNCNLSKELADRRFDKEDGISFLLDIVYEATIKRLLDELEA